MTIDSCFAQEKAGKKETIESQKKRENEGAYVVDEGVFDLVNVLNQIEFVYSTYSCSGMPEDHSGSYLDRSKAHVPKKGKQGLIELRVDTSNPNYQSFKQGLGSIEGVEFYETEFQDNENFRNMVIQAVVPQPVLDKSHPKYQSYLKDIWKKVLDCVQKYAKEGLDN